jgi:hypothetical protein
MDRAFIAALHKWIAVQTRGRQNRLKQANYHLRKLKAHGRPDDDPDVVRRLDEITCLEAEIEEDSRLQSALDEIELPAPANRAIVVPTAVMSSVPNSPGWPSIGTREPAGGGTTIINNADQDILARRYNGESTAWATEPGVDEFGPTNYKALYRKEEDQPRFQVRDGGLYKLVRLSGCTWVLPKPKVRLDEGQFVGEGVAFLFDCPEFGPGSTWEKVYLARPALVENRGDQWIVIEKGELRESRA